MSIEHTKWFFVIIYPPCGNRNGSPYATGLYFCHDFVFVLVSWEGGGNPPWAGAKYLSLHCGQENQASADFSSKLDIFVYGKSENATKRTRQRNTVQPTTDLKA